MYPDNQSPQNNPYAFITQSPQTPKRNLLNPNSKKARIIIAAVGVALLGVIAAIILSILGSSGNAQTEQYLEIAKRQTEIIRLATLAEKDAKTTEVRAVAATAKLSTSTAQSDMRGILVARGVGEKGLNKELSASKNTKSDQLLTEAAQNNRYDETISEILKNEIANYQKQLSEAAAGATKSERQKLEQAFNQAALLYAAKQATTTQ